MNTNYKTVTKANEIYWATLSLFDTGGQNTYSALVPIYLKTWKLVIIVFDITDYDSFLVWEKYLKLAYHCCPKATKILVGNKIDLNHKRTVPYDKALKFANKNEITYFEVSVATSYNLEFWIDNILMIYLDEHIIEHDEDEEQSELSN